MLIFQKNCLLAPTVTPTKGCLPTILKCEETLCSVYWLYLMCTHHCISYTNNQACGSCHALWPIRPASFCAVEALLCNREIVSSIGHKIIKEFVAVAAFCRPFSLSQFLGQSSRYSDYYGVDADSLRCFHVYLIWNAFWLYSALLTASLMHRIYKWWRIMWFLLSYCYFVKTNGV